MSIDVVSGFVLQAFSEVLLLSLAFTSFIKYGFSFLDSLKPSKIVGNIAIYCEHRPLYIQLGFLFALYYVESSFVGKNLSLTYYVTFSGFDKYVLNFIASLNYLAQTLLFYFVTLKIVTRFLPSKAISSLTSKLTVYLSLMGFAWMLNTALNFEINWLLFVFNEGITLIFIVYVIRNWKKIRHTSFPLYMGAMLFIAIPYYATVLLSLFFSSLPLINALPFYVTVLTGILYMIIIDRELGKVRIQKWK